MTPASAASSAQSRLELTPVLGSEDRVPWKGWHVAWLQALWAKITATLEWIGAKVRACWAWLVVWFGPTVNSIKGHVNAADWLRILTLVLTSGSVLQILTLLATQSSTIFSNAEVARMVSLVATAMIGALDYLRRRAQGATPPPPPTATITTDTVAPTAATATTIVTPPTTTTTTTVTTTPKP